MTLESTTGAAPTTSGSAFHLLQQRIPIRDGAAIEAANVDMGVHADQPCF